MRIQSGGFSKAYGLPQEKAPWQEGKHKEKAPNQLLVSESGSPPMGERPWKRIPLKQMISRLRL